MTKELIIEKINQAAFEVVERDTDYYRVASV